MNVRSYRIAFSLVCFWTALFFFGPSLSLAGDYPVSVTDSLGRSVVIPERPVRVVSVVPSATEILFALGVQDSIQAITIHSTNLPGAEHKAVVGGYFSPSLKRIEQAAPDLIIFGKIHEKLAEHFSDRNCRLLFIETRHMTDGFRNIRLLGRVFGREEVAESIIVKNQDLLDTIREKVARIPVADRKRVMRIMGRDELMAPGDDSFQNELITAAGGIAPTWEQTGPIVPVTQEAWRSFNPQVIYGCGEDRRVVENILSRPVWKEVDAVKRGRIYYFPCDLTCRAATHVGDFVAWLSSVIYPNKFADPQYLVRAETVLRERSLEVDLPYVKDARIVTSIMHDFINKTLIIDFKRPQWILSSLEGERSGIKTVGNHYSPPPCWLPGHHRGLAAIRAHVYEVLKQSPDSTSFLFTGADMDNLAVRKSTYQEMTVVALVTAGVRSNALRLSKDKGNYYEPGTINIILLSNTNLSRRAMARAVITATEAKTAALWDLDVRSTATPAANAATGTGTDNIIVVSGEGPPVDNAGGHSKLGELIASSVYGAVMEAVKKQNSLIPPRNVFQRLQERRIDIYQLAAAAHCDCAKKESKLAAAVEEILLEPRYAAFLENAFVISDAYQRGLIGDLTSYEAWCRSSASEIAAGRANELIEMHFDPPLPKPLELALRAIFTGAQRRIQAGKR